MPDITPEVSAVMAAWGRKGGSVRGGKKAAASRANGQRRKRNSENEQSAQPSGTLPLLIAAQPRKAADANA